MEMEEEKKVLTEMLNRGLEVPNYGDIHYARILKGMCGMCPNRDMSVLILKFKDATVRLCLECELKFFGDWVRCYYRRQIGRAKGREAEGPIANLKKDGGEIPPFMDDILILDDQPPKKKEEKKATEEVKDLD